MLSEPAITHWNSITRRADLVLNVLLIGAGGREHALAWALQKSPALSRLFVAPGNGGIADEATCIDLDAADHEAVAAFCTAESIGLVVIGPEAPLVAGLSDHLEARGVRVFGPSAAAAQLEGSKGFTKDLCARAGIPTAAYRRCKSQAEAYDALDSFDVPVVVKADGLAAGKGVVIAEDKEAARGAIDACFDGAFGGAGAELVLEEFLVGEEASFFALCDGKTALPLATAQDHKRLGDGDTGPNTGGMGAYSPAPVTTDALIAETMDRIINPTLAAMAEAGTPYRGVLYAGLMITDTGPQLIEYNVRFGDPEAQVLVMRLKDDLLALLNAAVDGHLAGLAPAWHDDAALTVVMASTGYPGSYAKNTPIGGLDALKDQEDLKVFHAGTAKADNGFLATGGRVLAVTARAPSIGDAQKAAYRAIQSIEWPEGIYRRDIGWRAAGTPDDGTST